MKTTSALMNCMALLPLSTAVVLALHSPRTSAMDLPTILTWSDDPRTSMTISWWRDASGTGMVEYGTVAGSTTNLATEPTASTDHRIVLSNLAAGAAYWYRTTSTDTDSWTVVAQFRTAPGARTPVQIGVVGDTRSNHLAGLDFDAPHQAVADAMAAHSPHVWLNVGDLVENGTTLFDWEHFLAIERTILARSPYAPVIGSHDLREDRNASLFWKYFATPGAVGKIGHWSFDVGNVHVVMLNSEEDISGQTPWIETDLDAAATNPAINWLVAVFHQPAYGAAPERINAQIVAEWCPLFERYAVDFVFAGHNHVYHRSTPINGVRYVLSGGGGAELHPSTISEITAYGTSRYQFVLLDFSNHFACYEARGTNDDVFDACIVTNIPMVTVTNDDMSVAYAVTNTAIGGTTAKTAGTLFWTNSANGAAGSAQVSSFKFQVAPIPLSEGTNTITVRATNAWGIAADDSVIVVRETYEQAAPHIAASALVFPSSNSLLRVGTTTALVWHAEQITDTMDGTNLLLATIALLDASTTAQVVMVTNNIASASGNMQWLVDTNLLVPGVDYVVQFEAEDNDGLTTSHIFASQPFSIVPEAGTAAMLFLFSVLLTRTTARTCRPTASPADLNDVQPGTRCRCTLSPARGRSGTQHG